jgi:hypothetical protein
MNSLSCEEIRELAPAYALDSLNPATTAAVRQHLAAHPGAHPEFAEFAEVAPALAYLVDPVKPPAALKGRLLAAVAATPPAAPSPTPVEIAIVPAPGRSDDGADALGRGRGAPGSQRAAALRWILAAAAVVAIVALGARDLALQQDVSTARQFGDQVERAMSLAASSGSRIAVIGAAAGSTGSTVSGPSGLAVMPGSGSGVLVMHGLAPTGGSQVYEAWAIVGSGAPVPLGSFAVGGDGLGWLADLALPPGSNVVVALTKEPGPGATKPTLPIVASGTAGPRS